MTGNTFPKWYDLFMAPLERKKLKAIRKTLLQKAEGTVLEIGSGTGVNFPYYQNVLDVTAIEPNAYMIKRSTARKNMSAVPIKVMQESAERLPFADHTFDTVVATLVLCTISNPELAVQEMKRVCKSEGKILVLEHVRIDNPFLATLQDWLTPFWKQVCDGCCLNRRTVQTLEANGLEVLSKKTCYKGLFVQLELKKRGGM